jgi:hypothetical protein
MGSMESPKVANWLGLFIAMAFAIPGSAHAECIALWKTAPEALRGSTLVFSGTVIKSSVDLLQTSFEVDRVWKGEVRQRTTLTLYPGLESRSAAYFKQGVSYLVFASLLPTWKRSDGTPSVPRDPPVFEVGECSPTRPLLNADAFVKQLGRAWPPLP